MIYGRLTTEYLCYLMNRVQIEAEGPDGYLDLCKLLLRTPFIPILEMDENRSADCREHRSDFIDKFGYGYFVDEFPESGTMMELLVVLTERMKYDLISSEYDASPRKFFLEMLENAHIAFMNCQFDESIVESNLALINIRQFMWDGEYSFFPLRYPHTDQRYEELLVQMNNYIEENYDIC